MKLGNSDGAVLTLVPSGYQFPLLEAHGVRDWDANWLIVDGTVMAADGRVWRFRDPCLTTWESAKLSTWLRAVASGLIAPTTSDGEPLAVGDSESEGVLAFTEPVVALSLASRDEEHVSLRVHLSHKAGPPHLPEDKTGIFEYFVTVKSSSTDLSTAIDVWDSELASFPAR